MTFLQKVRDRFLDSEAGLDPGALVAMVDTLRHIAFCFEHDSVTPSQAARLSRFLLAVLVRVSVCVCLCVCVSVLFLLG